MRCPEPLALKPQERLETRWNFDILTAYPVYTRDGRLIRNSLPI